MVEYKRLEERKLDEFFDDVKLTIDLLLLIHEQEREVCKDGCSDLAARDFRKTMRFLKKESDDDGDDVKDSPAFCRLLIGRPAGRRDGDEDAAGFFRGWGFDL